MLENGDLIFCERTCQIWDRPSKHQLETTAMWLSFWMDRSIMQLKKGGVLAQSPEDFFEAEKVYDLYRYAQIACPEVKKRAKSLLGGSLQCVLLS